jgi:hypothetical protein
VKREKMSGCYQGWGGAEDNGADDKAQREEDCRLLDRVGSLVSAGFRVVCGGVWGLSLIFRGEDIREEATSEIRCSQENMWKRRGELDR